MTIAEYKNYLKKKLKSLLGIPKSQAIFFALFINYCRYLKKKLET